MPRQLRDLVTVSPPTFDQTRFAAVDRQLCTAHAPYDKSWIMARFEEGLQIRMLPPPASGLVLFQPGRLSWRPIEGLDSALVVHDLRVAADASSRSSAARLWTAVELFARFYGFSTILALMGSPEVPHGNTQGAAHGGLIAPDCAPGRGWITFDRGPLGARLTGRVLTGPVALPRLPRDWRARAAALGPGAVIQTTGESARTEARAAWLIARAASAGVVVRHDRLTTPWEARSRGVSPVAGFAALRDGVLLGGADRPDAELLHGLTAP